MKSAFILFLALIMTTAIAFPCFAAEKDPYALQVKKLFAAPDYEAKIIYEIPIKVVLLDISEDANWYKVSISFDLGLLGKYNYVGWSEIPVGTVLAQREEKKLASTIVEK